MDIKNLILKEIKRKDKVKTADLVKITGFSRAYINRFIQELKNEGKIVLIGKANRACYAPAKKGAIKKIKREMLAIHKTVKNKKLSEDVILDEIKRESGIFIGIKRNVGAIFDYAFTEILNNAIEHSRSKDIEIKMKRDNKIASFEITDRGVGIFNNIIKKRKLKNELEAIHDLLKGKQTTLPKEHSGEGIFFTSKAADAFVIKSSNKKLTFNNFVDDVFIQNIKNFRGTKAIFTISLNSKRKLEKIFSEYTDESYEFSKTKVKIKLYKIGVLYLSRSQARRIMVGLDKFKTVILDFSKIETVGQAFADEIFRVWQNRHPKIKIISQNTNENVDFMIKRAK